LNSKVKILDCTLRDGGYYNNWDFSFDLVQAYLEAVALSGIDYVELGLRDFPKNFYRGPFAYTTERLLNRLSLPSGPEYGVMINAGSIITESGSVQDNVDRLFCDKEASKLSLVRVACHFHEVVVGAEIASILKGKGYLVGLNLMQAEGLTADNIEDSVSIISECNSVDVLYFADSFGRMRSDEVERITLEIKKHWSSSIGIHTHNNMGYAISNTLCAKKIGVSWHDCTITGMGRGAGNAESELLVGEFLNDDKKYDANPLLKLAVEYFEDMKKELGWGKSSVYYLGAVNAVHPTYIQKLLADPHFTKPAILDFIDKISKQGGSKYSGDHYQKFKKIVNQVDTGIQGISVPMGVFGNEALLLGGGDSVSLHDHAIKDFIESEKVTVASVNINRNVSVSIIDFIFLTKNTKYTLDKDLYQLQESKYILPFSRFTIDEVDTNFSGNAAFDYKLVLSEDFKMELGYCYSPFDLTAIYALSALISCGVRRIFLVGFDGYSEPKDPRNLEMTKAFEYIYENFPEVEIISLLPSNYDVPTRSIYEY
jgi:4-hydroxy 2-oxovalerate aldolase